MLKRYTRQKLISIGSNCYSKMLINTGLNISQETHFFDYLGTSMWSIIDLLENNFDGMYERENYKKIRVLETGGDDFMLVNIKYYIRIKHDFKQDFKNKNIDTINEEEFNKFVDKYKRREERFKEIIKSNEHIVFLRYEENQNNRIQYYENKIDEYEGIKKFLQVIKRKNKNVRMILFSESRKNNYDEENGILVLEVKPIKNWVYAPEILKQTLISNDEFLKKNDF